MSYSPMSWFENKLLEILTGIFRDPVKAGSMFDTLISEGYDAKHVFPESLADFLEDAQTIKNLRRAEARVLYRAVAALPDSPPHAAADASGAAAPDTTPTTSWSGPPVSDNNTEEDAREPVATDAIEEDDTSDDVGLGDYVPSAIVADVDGGSGAAAAAPSSEMAKTYLVTTLEWEGTEWMTSVAGAVCTAMALADGVRVVCLSAKKPSVATPLEKEAFAAVAREAARFGVTLAWATTATSTTSHPTISGLSIKREFFDGDTIEMWNSASASLVDTPWNEIGTPSAPLDKIFGFCMETTFAAKKLSRKLGADWTAFLHINPAEYIAALGHGVGTFTEALDYYQCNESALIASNSGDGPASTRAVALGDKLAGAWQGHVCFGYEGEFSTAYFCSPSELFRMPAFPQRPSDITGVLVDFSGSTSIREINIRRTCEAVSNANKELAKNMKPRAFTSVHVYGTCTPSKCSHLGLDITEHGENVARDAVRRTAFTTCAFVVPEGTGSASTLFALSMMDTGLPVVCSSHTTEIGRALDTLSVNKSSWISAVCTPDEFDDNAATALVAILQDPGTAWSHAKFIREVFCAKYTPKKFCDALIG